MIKKSHTLFLKSIAILAVLIIHILSSIKPSPFVNSLPYQLLAVSLDQLSRISVPLFVAISGYGLMQSYAKKKLVLLDFFKRRVLKVLPLYILWSCIYGLTFRFIFNWAPATEQPNFAWQLLLGRADYHLYFVPMIFQLYLFFPVLLPFFKKWPFATLFGSILIQLVWWWFFSYQGLTVTSWKYFAGDDEQYVWMTNWIAYFVLGMYLPNIWNILDKNKLLFFVGFIVSILSGLFAILNAVTAIHHGTDPLLALKFTRYPLFLYSSLTIIMVSHTTTKIKNIGNLFVNLGKLSYHIYLSHTLFLRIIFYLLYV